jgi:hypothetical protein
LPKVAELLGTSVVMIPTTESVGPVIESAHLLEALVAELVE